MDKTRTCHLCKQVKPLDEFAKNKSCPLGRGYACRVCNYAKLKHWRKNNPEKVLEQVRRNQKKHPKKHAERTRRYRAKHPERYAAATLFGNHGLTVEQYDALLETQNGSCAICQRSKGFGKGKASKLWVDHCHTELRIRGLLCQRCNLGLGYFEDSSAILEAAIRYLSRTSR